MGLRERAYPSQPKWWALMLSACRLLQQRRMKDEGQHVSSARSTVSTKHPDLKGVMEIGAARPESARVQTETPICFCAHSSFLGFFYSFSFSFFPFSFPFELESLSTFCFLLSLICHSHQNKFHSICTYSLFIISNFPLSYCTSPVCVCGSSCF